MATSLVQTFQATPTEGASATNRSESFLALPAVGNLVVVDIALVSTAGGISSVTDNQGNTYTAAESNFVSDPPVFKLRTYYTIVRISSGTFTVTANTDASTEATMVLTEYTGHYSFSLSNTNSATSTSTTASPGAVTPSASDAIYHAVMTQTNGVCSIAPNGGWTQIAENEGVTHMPIAVEYVIGTGAKTPDWTLGASVRWIALVTTYVPVDYNPKPTMLQVF